MSAQLNLVRVKIKSFAMIREIIGEKEWHIELKEPLSIRQVVLLLVQRFPDLQAYLMDKNQLSDRFIYILNRKEVSHDTLAEVVLQHEDELAILPPAGGG